MKRDLRKTSGITSVESRAAFHEKQLEKFVQYNLPPQLYRENKIAGMAGFTQFYREIESCAAETPVNGSVEIFFASKFPDATRRVSIPVFSRFFVFCTRDEGDEYKVAWSCSLS